MTTVNLWTIVQHSGYGYAGKDGFRHAVETRAVRTLGEKERVEKAGGLLFASYREADAFSEAANYPEGAESFYTAAKGTFSDKEIDELKIYLPVRTATG